MSPQPDLKVVSRTKMRYERVGDGYLKIYTREVDGVVVSEVFTFESLADVLGIPKTTLEGRYTRGALHHWMVPIQTGASRPVRGFPLPMLEQVAAVINTRGARVQVAGDGDGIKSATSERITQELVPTRYAGHYYYTIQALADHFGLSATTIRARLGKSGLMRKAVNLGSPSGGGRPRRGFPMELEPQLRDAISNGAVFLTKLDEAIARSKRTTVQSRYELSAPPLHMAASAPAPSGNVVPFKPKREAPAQESSALHDMVMSAVAEINAMVAATPKTTMRDVFPEPRVPDTPQPQDQWADMRAGMLGMLKMEGYSDEAIREGEAMLRDQGMPEDQILEVMQVAEQARAGKERGAGA